MILTLNQVIKVFNDFADGHDQINDFGYGSPSDISTSKQTSYPLLWMTSTTGTSYQATNKTLTPTHNFAFIIADVWNNQPNFNDVNGYNSSNVQEVMSDMELIARDLITFIQVNVQQLGLGISVEDNITIDPLEDESPDKIFGWVINCTLKLKHMNCVIPGDFDNVNPFPPANCDAATYRNSDSSFTQSIDSGSSYTSPDIDITLNSGAFLTIPSNKDQDVELLDQDDNPITPDSVVGNVIKVTTGGTSSSNLLTVTGQVTSYVANDDGAIQEGISFTTLSSNNPFGNTNRFTDTLGTQVYANGVYLDWLRYDQANSEVRAYALNIEQNALGTPNMGTANWTTWMGRQPFTIQGFGGWYVANKRMLDDLCNYSVADLLNYAPFNYSILSGGYQLYCSTTNPNLTTNTYALLINGEVRRVLKTNSQGVLLFRNYTLAELGL